MVEEHAQSLRLAAARRGRRFWQDIVLENALLFAPALFLTRLSLPLPPQLALPAGLLAAFLPALLWLINILRHDDAHHRRLQFGCALLAALGANAVALPLIHELYEVRRWLPLESAINRVIGYSLAIGLSQALTVWLAVRTLAWHRLRAPADVLACTRAAAIGFLSVQALGNAPQTLASPATMTIAVFNQNAPLTCVAFFCAWGLTRLRFSRRPFILMPSLVCALGSLVAGGAIPLIAGFTNANINLLELRATASPLIGALFSLGLLLANIALFRFLFSRLERIWREESPTSVRAQRWSQLLLLAFGLAGILVSMGLRELSLNASSEYLNPETGLRARYPANWLLEEGTGGLLFRARDTSAPGFATTIQVARLPVSPRTGARNLLDSLTLQRAQTLAAYSILSEDPYFLPDGRETRAMRYSFVSTGVNPFLRSNPVVVEGLDILILTRNQALVVSFRAAADVWMRELSVLQRFLDELSY